MHISLTPELEAQVKNKVETGYYNNASEVIRDALRFMIQHEELINLMKIDALKKTLAVGEAQSNENQVVAADMVSIIREAKDDRDA